MSFESDLRDGQSYEELTAKLLDRRGYKYVNISDRKLPYDFIVNETERWECKRNWKSCYKTGREYIDIELPGKYRVGWWTNTDEVDVYIFWHKENKKFILIDNTDKSFRDYVNNKINSAQDITSIDNGSKFCIRIYIDEYEFKKYRVTK